MLLWTAIAAAQPASLEGTAVNSLDGQALSGVHISLIGISATGIRDAYGAMSDPAGHFSIGSVPPGMYILFTEKRGFLHVETKKSGIPLPSVGLKAGEHKADFKLEMTPRAVITGRVVDESGDPVENAQVHAQPVSKDSEPIALTFGEDFTRTDDHGAFRISGPPGKFYIRATPGESSLKGPPEIRLDSSVDIEYTNTFYPSAASEEQAAPVEAKAGAEVSGIEIRLVRQVRKTAPTLTVSGAVHGYPTGPNWQQHTNVWLARGEKPDDLNDRNDRNPEKDGSFALRELEPGFYRMWAAYDEGPTHLQSRPVEFKLDGSDVTGLQLNLEAGGDLIGTVEVAGERQGAAKEKRKVRIGDGEGQTDGSGAFRISGIMPGKATVEVDPLPENAYVKSLVMDGAAMPGDRLDLSHGVRGSKLKIVVSTGGEITGNVLDKDGQRSLNSVTAVFLVPDDGDFEPRGHNPARVDESAAYSFHGVRPGKYHLLAYDLFASGFEIGDQDKVKKAVLTHGEALELKEGDRIRKDVTIYEEQADGKK